MPWGRCPVIVVASNGDGTALADGAMPSVIAFMPGSACFDGEGPKQRPFTGDGGSRRRIIGSLEDNRLRIHLDRL